ncbi:MFS transporter [Halobacterium sp. R2-5]|uniref:MFS transporter n=1 Tax=Halobacterium sp. R2-5 TaxID=2715751 RepID=UPI0014228D78|nr:MFS transporter [Halobacterium sp. R2-5]NIC01020.1 MFS transporter [Halobacterium sp. R2-5]
MNVSWRSLYSTVRTYDLVVLVSLLWFMVQFLRFVFPPLFETFQAIYNVSNTQTGILFTAMMLAYSTVQFPAGMLGDRIGRSFVILLGATVFAFAALLAAASPSFAVVLIAAIMIGLGTGPHKAVAIPLLSSQYPDRTGRALGVMDTIGQLGGMTAPLAVAGILAITVWQGVFVLGATVTAILILLFLLRVRNDDELMARGSAGAVEGAADGEDVSYLAVFRNRSLLLFMVVTMLFTFAWNGLSSFFPLFLATEKGLDGEVSGILYSLLFAASVSQTVTGDLSDRMGRLRVSSLLFAAMFLGITTLVVAESLPVLVVTTVVVGAGFHGFRPVRDSYLMDVIPESIGGGTLGVIRTGMTGVGALAPAFVGYISDVVGFVTAFAVIAGVSAVAGLIVVLLR